MTPAEEAADPVRARRVDRGVTRTLVAGTVTKYALLTASIGTGIFLMPFTVRHLGKPQYGLWMLVASLTSYFSLLDLGYGNGLVRHIVAAYTRGDVRRVNEIASTFVCIYAVIGLAACLVTGGLVLLVVPHFPNLTSAEVSTARIVLALMGFRIAVGFPMTVFGAVTNARHGFVLNNSIALVMVIVNALLTYVVLAAGGGLVMLVAVTTAASLTGYIGYAWSAHRVFPALSLRVRHFSRDQWREVTSFSVYLFIIDMASQVTFNLDNVVVGAFLGTSAVAVYAVAVRLSEYQRRVCDQFSGMLYTVAVGFGTGGRVDRLRNVLIEGTRLAVVLVVGVTICLVGFIGPLISRWMGPGFGGSVPAFVVLSIVGIVMVGHATQQSILLATGRHRTVTAIWIVEAAANLALSLILVRRFGALGVAAGTAIPIAVGHLLVMTPTAARSVGLPLWRYARETLLPALIGGVPAAALCIFIRLTFATPSLGRIALGASLVGAVYLAVVATFGLDRSTRRLYLAHLSGAASAVRDMSVRRVAGPHIAAAK